MTPADWSPLGLLRAFCPVFLAATTYTEVVMVSLSVAVSQHTLSLSELDSTMTVVHLFTLSHMLSSTHIYTSPTYASTRQSHSVIHGSNCLQNSVLILRHRYMV